MPHAKPDVTLSPKQPSARWKSAIFRHDMFEHYNLHVLWGARVKGEEVSHISSVWYVFVCI